MIVKYLDSEHRVLVDRALICELYQRPLSTVRKHCVPAAWDPDLRRWLYDPEAARQQLEHITGRNRAQKINTSIS